MACAQAWPAAPPPISQGQSSGKPIAGHLIPRIKCLSCSYPDFLLILLIQAMGKATGDIRAAYFTSSDKGDSPIPPHLLDQIPPDEPIDTVTGDGAHDTRRCHAAILKRGGKAVIPIRKNGRGWRENCPAAKARNEILKATQRLGRAAWKRWSGYHTRSRIEAKMRCLKSFGERIVSRDPDRQTAEVHPRCTCEPPQCARHGRDRTRGMSPTGKRPSGLCRTSATTPFASTQ